MLVTREGRVVILDFGLVAEVEGPDAHDSLSFAGTPDFMSPEQGAQRLKLLVRSSEEGLLFHELTTFLELLFDTRFLEALERFSKRGEFCSEHPPICVARRQT